MKTVAWTKLWSTVRPVEPAGRTRRPPERSYATGVNLADSMDPAVRFWLLVLAALGTLSGVALLVVSAFLPGAFLGEADTVGYVVSVFVALASLGLLVWSLTADAETATDGSPGTR